MTQPKLRRSWDGKIEAQAGLGVAKPKVRGVLGSTWGRSRGTLGRFWEVQGGQGKAPEKFRGPTFLLSCPGRTNI